MILSSASIQELIILISLIDQIDSVKRRIFFPKDPELCSAPIKNSDPKFVFCVQLQEDLQSVDEIGEYSIDVKGVTNGIPMSTHREFYYLESVLDSFNYQDKFPLIIEFQFTNKDEIYLGNNSNPYLCLGYQSENCSIYIQTPITNSIEVVLRRYDRNFFGLNYTFIFNPPELRDLQEWDFTLYRFSRRRGPRSNEEPKSGRVELQIIQENYLSWETIFCILIKVKGSNN